jgi:hypothetical protein
VVLTRGEAAATRAVWLRLGVERAEELLGVSHVTLSRAIGRLPVTATKAALLRERLCTVSAPPLRSDRI